MTALGDLRPGDAVVYRAPHVPATDRGEAGIVSRIASKERGAFVVFRADGAAKLCPASTLEKVAP